MPKTKDLKKNVKNPKQHYLVSGSQASPACPSEQDYILS